MERCFKYSFTVRLARNAKKHSSFPELMFDQFNPPRLLNNVHFHYNAISKTVLRTCAIITELEFSKLTKYISFYYLN